MKLLLLSIFLMVVGISEGQVYCKFGAAVAFNPVGLGGDLDVGYKIDKAHISIGYIADAVNDHLILNLKAGYHLLDEITVHAGIGYVNWSTDDKRKGYLTTIYGVEYNFEEFRRSRPYVGLDISQNHVYIKVGMKINY